MQIGLTIFPTEYSIQPTDLALEAEARDFESLWLPEHSHIPANRKSPWPGGAELPKYYCETYDPFVSLGAAAAVTKKIKLATGICLVVERDPIHTAKEVSTIDRLSAGRFIFGVGGGWNAEEMANHDTVFETRFKMMRERILAMKEIWTQPTPKFAGEFSSSSTKWCSGQSRCKGRTHRSSSGAAFHTLPSGRSRMATAGCRSAAVQIRWKSCRSFGRWRKKRADIPHHFHLASTADRPTPRS